MIWPEILDTWVPPVTGMQWRHGDDWQEESQPLDFEIPSMHSAGDVITVEEETGGDWRIYEYDGDSLRLKGPTQ